VASKGANLPWTSNTLVASIERLKQRVKAGPGVPAEEIDFGMDVIDRNLAICDADYHD
jgi:hypothetical protein